MTVGNGTILAVAGGDFTNQDTPAPPHGAGEGLTPGTFYAYPNPQLVARSTDQGKTWQVKELGPPIYAGTGSMTGLGWTPKGGANGISEQSAFVKEVSPKGRRSRPQAGPLGARDPACRRAPVRSRGPRGAPAAEGEDERR